MAMENYPPLIDDFPMKSNLHTSQFRDSMFDDTGAPRAFLTLRLPSCIPSCGLVVHQLIGCQAVTVLVETHQSSRRGWMEWICKHEKSNENVRTYRHFRCAHVGM